MTKTFKKASKLLACALVVAFTFVITLGSANAADQITVVRAEILKDYVTNHSYGFTVFNTSDGKILYCVDPDKKALSDGQSATFDKYGDSGLLYLLQNGYPNKSLTGGAQSDKYVTQAAVWWYMDETGQAGSFSNDFKNATQATDINLYVSKVIKPLVEQAKAARNNVQVDPSMTVNASGNTMTLTSDGKYYESAYLTANLKVAKTYTVAVSGATKNTQVVHENGNVNNTMNSGEKFKVRVPASEVSDKLNITVKFTATGTVQKAKIYKPNNTTNQRVVGLYDVTKTLTSDYVLKLTPEKHVCEVVGNTHYGKKGNVVDEETYNKECKRSCEIIDNKYYGKSGNQVDKRTYIVECKHVCEFTDDKYYGKDGEVVDKKTYNKQCNASCDIIDNEYYGKDGKVVDKKTFESECSKHSCEFTDDKYYGVNGNEVDKNTYDNECGQEVAVPNTASNISTLGIISGMILLVSGAGVIAYRKKMLF